MSGPESGPPEADLPAELSDKQWERLAQKPPFYKRVITVGGRNGRIMMIPFTEEELPFIKAVQQTVANLKIKADNDHEPAMQAWELYGSRFPSLQLLRDRKAAIGRIRNIVEGVAKLSSSTRGQNKFFYDAILSLPHDLLSVQRDRTVKRRRR